MLKLLKTSGFVRQYFKNTFVGPYPNIATNDPAWYPEPARNQIHMFVLWSMVLPVQGSGFIKPQYRVPNIKITIVVPEEAVDGVKFRVEFQNEGFSRVNGMNSWVSEL